MTHGVQSPLQQQDGCILWGQPGDQTVQLDFRVQLSAASGPRGLLILRFGGFRVFGVNFVFYMSLWVDLSFFVALVDLCVIVLDHFEFFCKSAKKHIICVFC